MRSSLLLLIACLLIATKSRGQDVHEKAKLFTALSQAKEDSTKALKLIEVGYFIYSGSKPDSAIYYYNQSYSISGRIHFTKGILKYYAVYGDILSSTGKYDEAIAMSLKAVSIAEQSKNKHFMGAAYNNIAGSYTDLNNVDKALEYYLKAISVYESLNDQKHLSSVYANLMGIFSAIGHSPDEALKYGMKAINVSRAIHNDIVLEEALVNISYVLVRKRKTGEALSMLNEAQAISKKLNDKLYLIAELVAFNEIYIAQGKYKMLKKNADEMGTLSVAIGNKNGLAASPYYLALYYFDAKDYLSASLYDNKALAAAKDDDIPDVQEKAYTLLSDLALIKGDLTLYHYNRSLSDSLKEKFHSDQLLINKQELETKYNLGKKQVQIDKLNKEKKIQQLTLQKRASYIIVLFLAVAALLIVGMLLRNGYRRKQKLLASEKELREQQIQNLEKEKQLLSAEALMEGQEAERSRLAKDLHDGLGGILTGTKYSLSSMKQNMIISAENAAAFEKTMGMLDQSITELRRIAHNMMPESLLKLTLDEALQDYCLQVSQSGALSVTYQSFDVENLAINDTVKINVYRIVQELINNATKHASASTAIVQITFKDEVLGIAVEDNGKGLNIDGLPYADGIGYQNIKSRIDFLKGNMDIQSISGKGTSILIKIPV
jgi:two-component system NarL family sensor kinase